MVDIVHTVIDIENRDDLDTFVGNLFTRFPFNDIFETEITTRIALHKHKDYESRLFLSGSAMFYIEDYGIVECSPGSYIEIPAGTRHSFEYLGKEPLRVLRFFSDNTQWTPCFCEEDKL